MRSRWWRRVHADGGFGAALGRRGIECAADAGIEAGDAAVHQTRASAAERTALAVDRRAADEQQAAATDRDARGAPTRHGVTNGLYEELTVVRGPVGQGQLPDRHRAGRRLGRAHR